MSEELKDEQELFREAATACYFDSASLPSIYAELRQCIIDSATADLRRERDEALKKLDDCLEGMRPMAIVRLEAERDSLRRQLEGPEERNAVLMEQNQKLTKEGNELSAQLEAAKQRISYVTTTLSSVDCGAAPVEELARRAAKAVEQLEEARKDSERLEKLEEGGCVELVSEMSLSLGIRSRWKIIYTEEENPVAAIAPTLREAIDKLT
jgi:chromosome segregation ATPase